MYDFESTLSAPLMQRYLFLKATEIRMPNEINTLQRGIEWIKPRLVTLVTWDQIRTKTWRITREDSTMMERLLCVAQALEEMNRKADEAVLAMEPKPEIRIERIKAFAESCQPYQFRDFHERLMRLANPTLIEWMLALAVYEDGTREKRVIYRNQKVDEAEFRKATTVFTRAQQALTNAESAVTALEKYIEEMNLALNKKKQIMREALDNFDNAKHRLEAVQKRMELEEESAESD